MNIFPEIPVSKKSLTKRKLVCGVGTNDAPYMTSPRINGKQYHCPYYNTWRAMLKRCYSPKWQAKYPTYKGCSVCVSWLTFTNFKAWMLLQPWQDNQLDKDILEPGNKIYSPDTCKFVSRQLNNLLCDAAASRGKYPLGVHWETKRKLFIAMCNVYGKVKNLGSFPTIEEASKAYRTFKFHHIRTIAKQQTDNDIRYGLHLHSERMFNQVIC